MLPDETECRFCAEVIKAKAIKCKHCGSDLTAGAASPAGTGTAVVREVGSAASAQRLSSTPATPVPEVLYYGPGSQAQNAGHFAISGMVALCGIGLSFIDGVGILAAVIGVLIGGFFSTIAYMHVAYRIYRITTGRMEIQSGILQTKTENVLMIRVKDIRYLQTLGDRLFGLGEILVLSSDATAPQLSFRGLKDGKRIYLTLSSIMEQTASKHGVVHY